MIVPGYRQIYFGILRLIPCRIRLDSIILEQTLLRSPFDLRRCSLIALTAGHSGLAYLGYRNIYLAYLYGSWGPFDFGIGPSSFIGLSHPY